MATSYAFSLTNLESGSNTADYEQRRLFLAISMENLLSYCDLRLLVEALIVRDVHMLTVTIPILSRKTVFSLFGATLILMFYNDVH